MIFKDFDFNYIYDINKYLYIDFNIKKKDLINHLNERAWSNLN